MVMSFGEDFRALSKDPMTTSLGSATAVRPSQGTPPL